MSLEKLYTIEVNDALKQNSECPFCVLEERLEKQVLDFTLGSSYMDCAVRQQTDAAGFCREHIKKMYQYDNALGNGWILKTRLEYLREEYRQYGETLAGQAGAQKPAEKQQNYQKTIQQTGRQTSWQTSRQTGRQTSRKKPGFAQQFLAKIRPASASKSDIIRYQETDCFVCRRLQKNCSQMLESFVYLLVNDEEFLVKVQESKGFCMRHFPELVALCERKLDAEQRERLIPPLVKVMNQNLDRMQEDIDWFIDKFDYSHKDDSWKNSWDALQRTIGKINGIKVV